MSFILLLHVLCAFTANAEEIVNGRLKLVTVPDADRTLDLPPPTMRGPVYYQEQIPASKTGTGKKEDIVYMLPSGYDPVGQSHALMVCWHGFNHTHNSVVTDSLVDDECEERNWVFLSILGYHECNYGIKFAQIHCTVAIDFLIKDLGLNINTSRIYMAGFSMGAGAAASYTCRHLSADEGYPIAGLITVAGAFDLIKVHESGDPAAQYWLEYWLGDVPANIPFDYKQISTLVANPPGYISDESMGQNLGHKLPVYIAYAGNDPLEYVPEQNAIFISMMNDLQARVMVQYVPNATNPPPHDWLLLDVDAAFDFLEPYSLEDQETESITFIADRNAKFFWAYVDVWEPIYFARVDARVDTVANKLYIDDSSNTERLEIDCAQTGLNGSKDLLISYVSTFTGQQSLGLLPIDEPTYVVNSNTQFLHAGYSYDAGKQKISLNCESPIDLDLKASYEPYNLTLEADLLVPIGTDLNIQMSDGDPQDNFWYFFSFSQVEFKVGYRHILVYPFFPTLSIIAGLDANGERSMDVRIPYDPIYEGIVIYQQFLTFDNHLKEVSNLSVTTVTL